MNWTVRTKLISFVLLLLLVLFNIPADISYSQTTCSPPRCYVPQGYPISPQLDQNIGYCTLPIVQGYSGCPSPYIYSGLYKTCIAYPLCDGLCIWDDRQKTCVEISLAPPSDGGFSFNETQPLCAKDINGDGDIDQTEIGQCVNTTMANGTQYELCLLDVVECNLDETDPTYSCPPGGSYNSSTGRCEVAPSSPIGDTCNVYNVNGMLEVYTSASSNQVCVEFHCNGQRHGPVCVSPPNGCVWLSGCSGVDAAEVYFISSTTYCVNYYGINSQGSYTQLACYNAGTTTCPSGYTYNPSTGKCEASPVLVCPSGFVYNSSTGKCQRESWTCPWGPERPCVLYNDKYMCSPHDCAIPQDTDEPDEPPSGLEDDSSFGDGSCLGTIYIFNGKKMRCRPSGLQTGFHNCCDEAKGKLYDSTGSTGMMLGDAIKAVYMCMNIIKAASYINSVYKVVVASSDAVVLFNSAGEMIDVLSGAKAQVWIKTAKQAGQSVGTSAYVFTSADTKFASYASNYIDVYAPQLASQIVSLAISHVISDPVVSAAVDLVAQSIFVAAGWASPWGIALAAVNLGLALFTARCDEQDILTSTLKESGYCHYVGSRCIKKLPLVGCVQKTKIYCCFNSKLARIIHEQGRPQLTTFGPGGGWGSAKRPNCRGFTPEEFQAIDFGRIDFSEYVEDIQRNVRQNLQPQIMQLFNQTVQQTVP